MDAEGAHLPLILMGTVNALLAAVPLAPLILAAFVRELLFAIFVSLSFDVARPFMSALFKVAPEDCARAGHARVIQFERAADFQQSMTFALYLFSKFLNTATAAAYLTDAWKTDVLYNICYFTFTFHTLDHSYFAPILAVVAYIAKHTPLPLEGTFLKPWLLTLIIASPLRAAEPD